MGIVLLEKTPYREIAVWQTEGGGFGGSVTAADIRSAARFTSTKRQGEHLSARAALRTLLPEAEIEYDRNGAPVLSGSGLHVGLSHCPGAGAAIISRVPCAVDIERAERDFTRVLPRYLSAGELTVEGSGHALYNAAVWCAKETLYKMARIPGTDLLEDIRILGFDPAGGTIEANLRGTTHTIGVRTLGPYVLCFAPV